jgi:hypothetical protein
MILAAIANSGFAYTSAYNPVSVQKDVWMWDILYNSVYLWLASALIGYLHFFFFNRIDALQH